MDRVEFEAMSEEKWRFQSDKDWRLLPGLSNLEQDEKVIQIVTDQDLRQQIIEVLSAMDLCNYVVHDEQDSVANIPPAKGLEPSRQVFMVALKSEVYPQLLDQLKAHLDQQDQARVSCSEALFQIRLED